MFMSTRYSKRSETSGKIFSVNDSLAKLCEYLNCEFSCSKLITCKYKDFRSTKIKFEQKTRLNNAIWRAWHIQYKQKKKARFLQFAAPFSDETAHSTSQAVILEGKYWRRRLDKVSREHKKWRRHLEDKLLRTGGLSKEQLEYEDLSESESDEDIVLDRPSSMKKDIPSREPCISDQNSFETLCAMYAFPDTLFSSVDKQKTQKNDLDLSIFKDSSGMIQPTLDHLNPCFDELMENFDFLFADLGTNSSYHGNFQPSPNMLLETGAYTPNRSEHVQYLKDDQFLSDITPKKDVESCTDMNVSLLNDKGKNMVYQQELNPLRTSSGLQGVIFSPQHGRNTNTNIQKSPLAGKDIINAESEKTSNFEELPPQLQAPNLTARLQAAMSTRPKTITRNKSDTSLSTMCRRGKKEVPLQAKKPRLKRNTSNNSLSEVHDVNTSRPESHKVLDDAINLPQTMYYQFSSSAPLNIPYTVTSILPKTATSVSTVTVLPKYTNTVVPLAPINSLPAQAILVTPEIQRDSSQAVNMKNTQPSFRNFTSMAGLCDDFTNSSYSSHSVSSIAKIAPMMSTNQQPALSSSHTGQSTVLVHPNIHRSTSSTKPSALTPSDNNNSIHISTPQANIGILPQSNEQQLIALTQLIQSVPSQDVEATMSYLELVQQQLNLIMKQHHEQIQMKYQLQLQAEKMLQQQQLRQQQQHSVVNAFKHDSNESLQFIASSSSNIKFDNSFKPEGNEPLQFIASSNMKFTTTHSLSSHTSTITSAVISKDLWTSMVTYVSNTSPLTSSSTIPSPVRVDTPPSKPLKLNDFLTSGSPKAFKKEQQSLVKTLQRMDDPQTSVPISFYDSSTSKLQNVQPITTQAFHPPTTLDSAMALVSLRHGTMAIPGNENVCRSSSNQGRNSDPTRFLDSSKTMEDCTKFTEDVDMRQISKPASIPDRTGYNEHRRQCHLSAEQKRRGLIKHAFEELACILPNSNPDGRPLKLSNAAILERTSDHILFLQRERATCDRRMNEVQQEIDLVRTAINDCQNKLPATGVSVPRQTSDNVKSKFFTFCKEMIYMNSKSWIFCIIMKSLFDSYDKCVSTKTLDEFLNSLYCWLDRHCTLPILRPIVLETLTRLSTNTCVLDNPNCLNSLANAALRSDDPTEIVSELNDSSCSTSSSSFTPSSSQWETAHWRK